MDAFVAEGYHACACLLILAKSSQGAIQSDAFTSWIIEGSSEALNWKFGQIGRLRATRRCCASYLKQHDVCDRHCCGYESVFEKRRSFISFLERVELNSKHW